MMNRLATSRKLAHQPVWKMNGAIAAILLALTLVGCTDPNSNSANSEANATIGEIVNGANTNLIGKTVTVSGEIEEVVSPKAFIIELSHTFPHYLDTYNSPRVLHYLWLTLRTRLFYLK
ncbi:MAG: hypothetical protein N4J56_004272 [Chroococcidiopsis sp. SAG 2025]|uniref:hypothetical protein n=1 Tax=Chroococcidiopsis sp. SAG 2025 TaxID=171389 RepID=UPI0029371909|nr:hypothetical protein [Chroococcidiopsis sp. SAG 2025]MDV2994618.1 hypothetical protein [Chroococcidiopsis sp. SAG 2025]